MGTGQMDTETGEPLPTLMTQDPLGGAVHPSPHALATRVPDPQIVNGGQPETPADPPRVEDAQRISCLRRAPERPTPRHAHETNCPSLPSHPPPGVTAHWLRMSIGEESAPRLVMGAVQR